MILLSLERAKKAAFSSTLCVTVAYLVPEICSAKVITFLVQRSMRNIPPLKYVLLWFSSVAVNDYSYMLIAS